MADCVSCGGSLRVHRPYTFSTDDFRSAYRGDKVFRCAECNLSQVDAGKVDEAELTRYYLESYRDGSCNIALLGPTSEALYRKRAKALADLAMRHLSRPPTRVFEVGAGFGFNLFEFLDRFDGAWVGTDEPSPVASQNHAGRLHRAQLSDGPFDVVVLSHVLEHFSDPVDLLRRAKSALSPEGLIVIEVPNDTDGIIRYNGNDEPHLMFFEEDTLGTTLRQANLQILDLYGAGPPNVRDTLKMRAKRMLRNAVQATPIGNRLQQRRASAAVSTDDRFDRKNPDGLFLRAAVR